METRPAAYAVVIEQGKLLMTRWAPEDRSHEPLWTLPGGGMEPGEQADETALRETLEETGYSVAIEDVLGVHAGHFPARNGMYGNSLPFCALRIIYRAHIVTGQLRAEENGSSDIARWVPISEIDTLRYGTIIDEVASAAALAPILAACSAGDNKPKVDPSASAYGTLYVTTGVLGAKTIVAHAYAQALRNVGYTVEVIGHNNNRDEYLAALGATENTRLDVAVDFTGDLLLHLTKNGTLSPAQLQAEHQTASASASAASAGVTLTPSATPSIPADISPSPSPTPTSDPIKPRALSLSDTLSAIGKIIPGHLKLMDTVSAQNRNVLVTTNATGARYKFNSLNQLPEVKAPLTFAVPEAYNTGNYGIALLKNVYKYQVPATKVANESTEREQLLAKDEVQVALLHSIDPSIEDNRFTMLEDPQSTQLNQQLVPLVRQSLPSSAQEAINRVSSTLDTGNLTFLLRLTSGTNTVAEDEAAKFWLDHPRK